MDHKGFLEMILAHRPSPDDLEDYKELADLLRKDIGIESIEELVMRFISSGYAFYQIGQDLELMDLAPKLKEQFYISCTIIIMKYLRTHARYVAYLLKIGKEAEPFL